MISWLTLLSFVGIVVAVFSLYSAMKYKHQARIASLELKRQEKLTKSILDTEENEKLRISASLYDGLGQLLSVIKMNLQYMQSQVVTFDEKLMPTYYKTLELVDESVKELRSVSHDLMPGAFLRKGLPLLLAEMVDKIDSNKLQVHLNVEGVTPELDSNIQLMVYRIVQECIRNVIKHADATKLDISLIQELDFLHGTIEDNGVGFGSEKGTPVSGMGFENIRTRILYLKGELDISSQPGTGKLIAFHVPVNE